MNQRNIIDLMLILVPMVSLKYQLNTDKKILVIDFCDFAMAKIRFPEQN